MSLNRRTLLAGLGAACVAPRVALAQTPMTIVATTGMVSDAVRAIAGDAADVTPLMGPGVDPHGYRQTRSDIVAMTRADMVFWNGLYLEAQLEPFLRSLERRVPVTAVAEAVPADRLLRHAEYEGREDPHLWMVPSLWRHAVLGIRDSLSEARPDLRDEFAANAEVYLKRLDAVGAYAADILARIPEPARILVTAHDAFGYFGREYGLRVEGIQGISTESEAGLQRIGALVDLIVERGIPAVFVESSVSDRNVRALIEGAAAQGHDLQIGGELFSDAMGAPGTYEGTLEGMLDHNATVIARALGAPDVPERGMSGKLAAGS